MILAHSTHTWLPLTEQWIYRQVQHIHGIEQMVLCDHRDNTFDTPVETYINPHSVFDFKTRLRLHLGLPDAFRNSILKKYHDVILFSHYGVQGYLDLRLTKRKHITRFYGYDLTRTLQADKRWAGRYAKLFDQCDQFIVEGVHMKKVLTEMGCDATKIDVSYLGTETKKISFHPRQESEKFHVLIACATAERKGIIYALKALNAIIKEYKVPVQIHWVGARNSDYPEYIAYEKLLNGYIQAQNMDSYIIRYGFVTPEKLQEIASGCQVVLHPSVWAADGDCEGGYPVVLVDLMAGGLPAIATTHCDIPEVVNSDNGYLCPEKDIESLTEALFDCYRTRSYITKSVEARKTIEAKFDWEVLGVQLSALILK